MSIKTQLSALIQLAQIDEDFAEKEKSMIFMLGKANGLAEKEIEDLVNNPEDLPELNTLTDHDKFEILYNVVQLMKIDRQVYLSEIKYCEDLATKLGYNKKVISELSSKIYSDPTITTDRDKLQKIVRRFQE